MPGRKVTPDAESLPTAFEVAVVLSNGRAFMSNREGVALHQQAEQAGWTMQAHAPQHTFGYYRNGKERAVVIRTKNGLGLARIEGEKK